MEQPTHKDIIDQLAIHERAHAMILDRMSTHDQRLVRVEERVSGAVERLAEQHDRIDVIEDRQVQMVSSLNGLHVGQTKIGEGQNWLLKIVGIGIPVVASLELWDRLFPGG